MGRKKANKKLITIIAVVSALVLITAIIVVVKAMSQPEASVEAAATSNADTQSVTEKADGSKEDQKSETEAATTQPTVDPAQTASVTIEPMSITVSYVKGVGGFDYEVSRSPSGTKYVQFSSTKLVGTKCTDDKGQFATIIEKPTSDEKSTLAKTTTVSDTEYGLSLADATCTPDAELLKQYQTAFSDAFTLLK